MAFLSTFLYVLHILSCVILIVVVLLHESKGDSLAAVFGGGGADSAFGVQFGKKMSRFTAGAAAVFMILAIMLGIWANSDVQKKAFEDGMGSQQNSSTPGGSEKTGTQGGSETPTGKTETEK